MGSVALAGKPTWVKTFRPMFVVSSRCWSTDTRSLSSVNNVTAIPCMAGPSLVSPISACYEWMKAAPSDFGNRARLPQKNPLFADTERKRNQEQTQQREDPERKSVPFGTGILCEIRALGKDQSSPKSAPNKPTAAGSCAPRKIRLFLGRTQQYSFFGLMFVQA